MAKIKKVKNKTDIKRHPALIVIDIKRHPALIVICIFLFLLAGLGVYWLLVRSAEDENEATVPSSEGESTSEVAPIEEVEEESDTIQFEGGDPNRSPELSGYISHASNERGTLRVNVTIAQSLTSGTCTLIMTDETGEEANFTADIEMDVTTAMCNFEENVSTLAPGTWQLEVLLESGDKVGTVKGSVEI